MRESFDVVVVGARCAGSPLAMMLARAGVRVCLIDRDRFPSDTPSTHGIQPTGVAVLERLGVLPELLRRAPAITSGRMVFDDGVAVLDDLLAITGAPMLNVRRIVLDEVLVNAAASAGVEVRTGTPATSVIVEGGRVVGLSTPRGEIRAKLVVGADGMRSTVARLVGAREYHPTPNGRLFMWAYWEGDPTAGEAWIGKLDDFAYLVMPTDSGLALAGACPSIGRRAEARADREGVYRAGVRAWPELEARLAGLRREGPVYTMANMHGFFRQSAGPGWALVGDAGHFKDPTPGQGIADALRQAAKLATVIVDGLGGALDRAVHEWWRWRDDDAWEMYWFAHDLGAPGPTPPLLREAQRRIAADPELTAAAMRIFNHDVRPSEVLTRGFALRTLVRALGRRPGERRAILREAAGAARDDARRRRAAPR